MDMRRRRSASVRARHLTTDDRLTLGAAGVGCSSRWAFDVLMLVGKGRVCLRREVSESSAKHGEVQRSLTKWWWGDQSTGNPV